MGRFIHSILRSNQAIAADGDVSYDLPVNPLSAILLHISPLNNTAVITDYAWVEALLSALDAVRVTHVGAAVVDMNGLDLAALALVYHKVPLWQSNAVKTDNDRRSLVVPVFFGRRAFDPRECFPETRKGELQLSVTWDIADTGFDGLRVSIETIELPDAKPEFVEKVTTTVQTFAATGQNEVDLPVGPPLRGILAFGTSAFSGAAPAPTLGQMQVLRDNLQVGYSMTDFEVVRALMGLRGVPYPPDFFHNHRFADAAVGETNTGPAAVGTDLLDSYALLDFDPLMDDQYLLETAGAGRVHLRVDAETANLARFMPIQRVPASFFLERA